MNFIEEINEKWNNKRLQMIYDFEETTREKLLSIEIIDVDETIHEDEYSDEGFWSQHEMRFKTTDGETYILGVKNGYRSMNYEICNENEDPLYDGVRIAEFFSVSEEEGARIESLFTEFNIEELAIKHINDQLNNGLESRKERVGQNIVDVYETNRIYHYVLENGETISEKSNLYGR